MFLKRLERRKNGKGHTYWALVESYRTADGSRRTITAADIAKTRDGTTDRLRKRLSGDVDNIVLMALRKEPHNRYASAADLAADLARHLDDLPVLAVPPSRRYRLAKFVRRNRVSVSAVVVVFVTLVVSGGVAVWQAMNAARQRDIAQMNATRADTAASLAGERADEAERQSYVANILLARAYA